MSINGRIIADFELADGRRKQPTQYEAPQKGDKMKAIYVLAVGLMKLNETATAVAADLIWHQTPKPDDAILASIASRLRSIGLGDRSSARCKNSSTPR